MRKSQFQLNAIKPVSWSMLYVARQFTKSKRSVKPARAKLLNSKQLRSNAYVHLTFSHLYRFTYFRPCEFFPGRSRCLATSRILTKLSILFLLSPTYADTAAAFLSEHVKHAESSFSHFVFRIHFLWQRSLVVVGGQTLTIVRLLLFERLH